MRVTLIHNPGAGFEQPTAEELSAAIRQAGYEPDYHSTAEEDYEKALEQPGEIVAIAGGDGTVGTILKQLQGKDVLIGLLPMGTANNIGTSLHLNRSALELIAAWPQCQKKLFSIGTVQGPWGEERFLESVGLGIITKLIAVLDAKENKQNLKFKSREEELAYILKALEALLDKYQPVHCTLEIDGRDYSGNYLLVEVMNINYVGPNLPLAPKADPADEVLDVVMLEGNKQKLKEYIQARLKGEKATLDLTSIKGKHIKISSKSADVHVDDTIKNNSAGQPIVVKPGNEKLQFLVESTTEE